jgi:hypothetical protein
MCGNIMKKAGLLFLTLFLLSCVSALEMSSTIDTDVLVKGVDNSITLAIDVSDAADGSYNLYTLSDVVITPSEIFQVSSSSFQKEFEVAPAESLEVDGFYTFTYTLHRRGVEKIDGKATVNVLDLEDVLKISSDSINTSSNRFSFYVENKENVHLKNIKATFSSLLFDTTQIFDLEPYERKIINVVADEYTLKRTKAGVYVLNAVFDTHLGKKEILGTLFLGEFKGISTLEQKSGLLIRTRKISKVNAGNVVEKVNITVHKNIISRLFTTVDMEPTSIERKGFGVTYIWMRERLGPAEVFTISVKTSYVVPLLVILLVFFALTRLNRYSNAKVIVRKFVNPVRTKGGEFALRVSIAVKALKPIANLSLSDTVPRMVKLYPKFTGSNPSKIDHQSRRLHWSLGGMGAKEERTVSYIVYAKVGMVGKFAMPRARAVFEADNVMGEADSNTVFFMNEQTTSEM